MEQTPNVWTKFHNFNISSKLLTKLLGVSVFQDGVLANVALNKRSYQVSTYVDQSGAHRASFANDGNINSCARSQRETNPWWTVDLGAEQLVAQVNLINARDNAGSHLHFMVYHFINLSVLHEL